MAKFLDDQAPDPPVRLELARQEFRLLIKAGWLAYWRDDFSDTQDPVLRSALDALDPNEEIRNTSVWEV